MTERLSTVGPQMLDSLTLELELRTVDLGALVESVIAGLPSRERPRIRVECKRPVLIRGDEARLHFGLSNLLGMVLTSATAGSAIKIGASQHGRRATLTVLGMCRPRDHQWVAFDLVRDIATAHGGSAAVATFEDAVRMCIELPAARRAAGSWPRPIHVLLVDDSIQQVVALSEVLRHDGLDVEYVTCGADAVASVAARPPDVLVVDMQLPDVQAIDVIAQARAAAPDVAVALLTGYPREHPMVARALATTGSTYLGKPVDVDALFAVIATAVQ